MRKREISGRIALKTTDAEEAYRERFANTVERFDDIRLKEIIELRGEINVEEFAEDFIFRGSDEEEMRRITQDRTEQVVAAFSAIEAEVPRGELPHNIFRKNPDDPDSGLLAVPTGKEAIWQRVAQEVARQRRRRDPWDVTAAIAALTPAAMTGILGHQRQDQRIRDEREARAELAALTAEEALIEGEITRLSSGVPRLMLSIGLLAYFALGSVALPVVLLAMPDTPESGFARWGVTGLFGSGLMLLVVFLVSAAFPLRHQRATRTASAD